MNTCMDCKQTVDLWRRNLLGPTLCPQCAAAKAEAGRNRTPPPAAPGYRASAPTAADRDIAVGALWCVGGILVTVVTYQAAAQSGGRYLIAWGAILFGGLQFLRGLVRAGGK